MADSRAQSKTSAEKSYHPSGYKTSPALARARLPFRSRNILTGALVVAFGAGVFAYSIRAVKQEDFGDLEDLLPPPSQRQTLKTIEEELLEKRAGRVGGGLPLPAAGGSGFPPSLAMGAGEGRDVGNVGAVGTWSTLDITANTGTGAGAGASTRGFDRSPSSSPFQVSLPHTPYPTPLQSPPPPPTTSTSTSSTSPPSSSTSTSTSPSHPGYTPEDLETFNLFRLPFFPPLGQGQGQGQGRGRESVAGGVGVGVDVDRLGSVWEKRGTVEDDGRRRV